jgi:hypothetical protein
LLSICVFVVTCRAFVIKVSLYPLFVGLHDAFGSFEFLHGVYLASYGWARAGSRT